MEMLDFIKTNAQPLDIIILRGNTSSPGTILSSNATLYFVEVLDDYVVCALDQAMTRKPIISPFAILKIMRGTQVIYEMDHRNMVFGSNG